MATRAKLTPASPYFARLAEKNLPFVSSGCTLFDCALGGGYVLGRVVNIVGDKSTGKTLLAIEACANFRNKYPEGHIRYAEAEAAFDQDYAEALGMPVSSISFSEEGEVTTAEEFFADLEKTIDALDGQAGLYVIDSLDALSDKAEMAMKLDDKATFGMGKQKMMSQGFRKLVRKIESSNLLIIVISQIRENIGVTFGAKYIRSGGKALDFYCSHIIWLAELGKIKKELRGNTRVIGINVKAQVKKNKIGLPYREVEFPLLFGYGIDDVQAAVEWFLGQKEYGSVLDELRLSKTTYKTALTRIRDKGPAEVQKLRDVLEPALRKAWIDIETDFLPKAGKYA